MEKEQFEERIARLEDELKKIKEALKGGGSEQTTPEEVPSHGEEISPIEGGTLKCPKCGLFNPDSAIRCDCGYDFQLRVQKISPKWIKPELVKEEIAKRSEVKTPSAKPRREISEQVRKKWLQLETVIGERWLVWVGALVFAAGFGIFLKYAFEQGWLNEVARFTLGILGGFLFIGFGEFFYKKRFNALGQGLSGLGLIILYLTLFMGYHFYQIFAAKTSFLLFFVVTIGGMSIAMLHNAFPTAFLSAFGAFATPLMLADPTSTVYYEPMLFFYLLIINIGILYASSIKRWRALSFFSFLCTVFYFGSWYLREYTPSDFPLAAGFASAYFILFSFITTLYSIIWKKKSNQEDVLLVILNPVIFFLIGYKMLMDRGASDISPYLPLCMAVYHFILATIIRKINVKDIVLDSWLTGTAIGLLTLPVPMLVKSYWITVAWSIEAIIFIIIGSMIGQKPIRIGGLAIYLLVIYRLFFMNSFIPYYGIDHHLLFLNLKFLALFLSTLTFGLGALSFSKFKNITSEERTYARPLWTLFALGLFWITNLDLFSYFSHLAGIAGKMKWAYSTMLWSAFVCWLLLHGILKKVQPLRLAGLWLMGATAAKILLLDTPILYDYHQCGYPFLFNLKFLSQFIFLGSILASAFLYGRKVKKGEKFEEDALWLLWSTFTAILFLCLNLEVFSYFGHLKQAGIRMMRHIFTTMLWTGFSCWLLLHGILKKIQALRIAGLVLICATAAKLFFIDRLLLYNYTYGYPFLLNLKFLSLAFLLGVIAIAARRYVKKGIEAEGRERIAVPFLWSLFVSLLFLGLNFEVISYFGHFHVASIRLQSFIFTSMLWAIFSLFLIYLGIKKEIVPLRVAGLILATVTFIKLILEDTTILYSYTYGYPFLLNLKFASATVLLFTLAYAAILYTTKQVTGVRFEKKAVPYLWSLFLVLLFIEMHAQATLSFYQIWDLGEQRAAFALSLLWGIYGFGLLLVGILKKILPLRIAALCLFGTTLCKVLIVDINYAEKIYKMFALLGIGTIFLIAAYFYRRYHKKLQESHDEKIRDVSSAMSKHEGV